jgi:hypothetical protein
VTDRRPLVLQVRALRSIFIAGEHVPAGEVSVMLTDDALQAAAAGKVEIVGDDADRVRFAPAGRWGEPRTEPVSRQTAGAWMTPASDAALADTDQPRVGEARGYSAVRPRRGLAAAMLLAASRWCR